VVIAQMFFLEKENPKEDIHLYINSPGGSVPAGLAIYDTMQYVKPDVRTVCIGMAASMGAFLLATGKKGKRFALPNSQMLIHQLMAGGVEGQASDIEIEARQIMRMKDKVNELLAKHTGKSLAQVTKDTDRNFWLSAQEAKEYGVIDEVIVKAK
jgi:ATP-dependent Clp protease protease subunit